MDRRASDCDDKLWQMAFACFLYLAIWFSIYSTVHQLAT